MLRIGIIKLLHCAKTLSLFKMPGRKEKGHKLKVET